MNVTVTFIVVIVAKDGQGHWPVSRDVCQASACRAELVWVAWVANWLSRQ